MTARRSGAVLRAVGFLVALACASCGREAGAPPLTGEDGNVTTLGTIEVTARLVEVPGGAIFNVNFPAQPFAGARFTRLGKRRYQEGIVENTDPRGRKYYWIGGEPAPGEPSSGTDFEALRDGKVTVTPLHLDLTDYASLSAGISVQDELEALLQ